MLNYSLPFSLYKKNRISRAILISLLILFAMTMSGCLTKVDNVAVEPMGYPGKDDEQHPKLTVSQAIDINYLESQIKALTTEEMAGRLPGTKGNQLAVTHIENQMKEIGLQLSNFEGVKSQKGYRFSFEMIVPIEKSPSTMAIVKQNGDVLESFKFGSDFMYHISTPNVLTQGSLIGKIYLVKDYFELKDLPEGSIALVDNEGVADMLLYNTPESAMQLGGIIVYSSRQNSGEFLKPVHVMGTGMRPAEAPLAYYVDRDTMDQLVEASEENLSLSLSTDVAIEEVTAENVVGYLPGKKEEGFIIVGHLDHLGDSSNGLIYNGALDNASGTASVLALAKSLAAQQDRVYSYYFIALNGEEEGLFGAKDLAKKKLWNPEQFSIVNFDMIGSLEKLPIMVDATRTQSQDLQSDLRSALELAGFSTEGTDWGFSDHAPFEEQGFAGALLIEFDERYYHTVNDTIKNSLDIPHLAKILDVMLLWLL